MGYKSLKLKKQRIFTANVIANFNSDTFCKLDNAQYIWNVVTFTCTIHCRSSVVKGQYDFENQIMKLGVKFSTK